MQKQHNKDVSQIAGHAARQSMKRLKRAVSLRLNHYLKGYVMKKVKPAIESVISNMVAILDHCDNLTNEELRLECDNLPAPDRFYGAECWEGLAA